MTTIRSDSRPIVPVRFPASATVVFGARVFGERRDEARIRILGVGFDVSQPRTSALPAGQLISSVRIRGESGFRPLLCRSFVFWLVATSTDL